jgi:hypothetical protein
MDMELLMQKQYAAIQQQQQQHVPQLSASETSGSERGTMNHSGSGGSSLLGSYGKAEQPSSQYQQYQQQQQEWSAKVSSFWTPEGRLQQEATAQDEQQQQQNWTTARQRQLQMVVKQEPSDLSAAVVVDVQPSAVAGHAANSERLVASGTTCLDPAAAAAAPVELPLSCQPSAMPHQWLEQQNHHQQQQQQQSPAVFAAHATSQAGRLAPTEFPPPSQQQQQAAGDDVDQDPAAAAAAPVQELPSSVTARTASVAAAAGRVQLEAAEPGQELPYPSGAVMAGSEAAAAAPQQAQVLASAGQERQPESRETAAAVLAAGNCAAAAPASGSLTSLVPATSAPPDWLPVVGTAASGGDCKQVAAVNPPGAAQLLGQQPQKLQQGQLLQLMGFQGPAAFLQPSQQQQGSHSGLPCDCSDAQQELLMFQKTLGRPAGPPLSSEESSLLSDATNMVLNLPAAVRHDVHQHLMQLAQDQLHSERSRGNEAGALTDPSAEEVADAVELCWRHSLRVLTSKSAAAPWHRGVRQQHSSSHHHHVAGSWAAAGAASSTALHSHTQHQHDHHHHHHHKQQQQAVRSNNAPSRELADTGHSPAIAAVDNMSFAYGPGQGSIQNAVAAAAAATAGNAGAGGAANGITGLPTGLLGALQPSGLAGILPSFAGFAGLQGLGQQGLLQQGFAAAAAAAAAQQGLLSNPSGVQQVLQLRQLQEQMLLQQSLAGQLGMQQVVSPGVAAAMQQQQQQQQQMQ